MLKHRPPLAAAEVFDLGVFVVAAGHFPPDVPTDGLQTHSFARPGRHRMACMIQEHQQGGHGSNMVPTWFQLAMWDLRV